MNEAFTLLATNLGMPIENIILFLVCVGCMVFWAIDFRIGTILLFVASTGLFLWFYNMSAYNWNWAIALTVSLVSLVILSLTLYFNMQVAQRGGFV